MPVVISDELQDLFDLRDHRAAAIDRFIIAEAELQAHMQQNILKDFVEMHDLEITHKLMSPVLKEKQELETINGKFEEKKRFFMGLMEASGCLKLHCSNKEFNTEGNFEYIHYVVSLAKNIDGLGDLHIHQKGAPTKLQS